MLQYKKIFYFNNKGGFIMEKTKGKLWGVYNTFNNPEMIETLDEIDIWLKIDSLSRYLDRVNRHRYSRNPWIPHISNEDLTDAQHNLEYLVYSTRRFGVEFSKEPSATEHVENSESYCTWFRFWYNHFRSMEPEVYNQFIDNKLHGRDTSKYMPPDSWKNPIKTTNRKKLYYKP